jgi:hypothetical protein
MDFPLDILSITLSYLDGLELFTVLKSSEEIQSSLHKYGKSIPLNLQNTGLVDDDLKHFTGAHTVSLWNKCPILDNDEYKILGPKTSIAIFGDNIFGRRNIITNNGLKYLKSVISIDIRRNINITDEGLKYLESVKSINISSCDRITDEGLKHLKAATDVELRLCKLVTDKGLQYLESVKSINISY